MLIALIVVIILTTAYWHVILQVPFPKYTNEVLLIALALAILRFLFA